MIYDPISVSLPEWEKRWTENGLQERHLKPGRAPEYIETRLAEEFGTAPLPALVHWFAWRARVHKSASPLAVRRHPAASRSAVPRPFHPSE